MVIPGLREIRIFVQNQDWKSFLVLVGYQMLSGFL